MNANSRFRSGFVSIIGRPNVGKSTLLNRLLGQKIAITSDKPQTTRNRILGILTEPQGQVLFLDTPGIHRPKGRLNRFMVDQALDACRGVELVYFLVESSERPGGGDQFVLDILKQSSARVFLVINKIDKVRPEQLLPLIEHYANRFEFAEVFPVSALQGEGIDALVAATFEYLPEGPLYYPEDMVTDLPERFIVAEMVREQLLRQTRDEIPYGVAVEVESFEERTEKGVVVIGAVIHVERETHKRIVVGKNGSRIRKVGEASRREIESFLGSRVFLDLFVHVQKNWTDSDRQLRRFGYE